MANSLFNPKGMSFGSVPMPSSQQQFLGNVGDAPPSPNHINRNYSGATDTIQYWLDKPKYYMDFQIYDYSRADLMSIGDLKKSTRCKPNNIIMPLSDQIIDPLNAKWEQKPIPWMVAAGVNEVINMYKQPGQQKAPAEGGASPEPQNQWVRRYGEAAIGAVRGIMATDLLGAHATASTLLGVAPNQFFTVLFEGPEYKKMQFQWTLSPNHVEESQNLKRIVNTFKMAMSPFIVKQVLWGYPCVFKIMFMPNNHLLFKTRPCVLTHFQVNYTPLGRAGFHYSEAPVGAVIQAQFLELEYWTKEVMSTDPKRATDFEDSSDR